MKGALASPMGLSDVSNTSIVMYLVDCILIEHTFITSFGVEVIKL